ncbi:MAG: hypothetical protein FJY92_06645, partial [Candidatus Hydrogenedentes bacterium]|nr:hypothetical protein [Candidatus Hydrogenedentota bacterium]
MTTAAAWIVCSIAALAAPGAYGVLESISGQPDCAAAAGNGPLTVGIDATGNVSVCRWPGPTAPNHVYYD